MMCFITILLIFYLQNSNAISNRPRDVFDYLTREACGLRYEWMNTAFMKCIKPWTNIMTNESAQGRIVGAWQVITGLEEQHPWFVKIDNSKLMNKKGFCGGSILLSHWVLTAAHCVENIPGAPGIKPSDYHKLKIEKLGKWSKTFTVDEVHFVKGRESAAAGHIGSKGKINKDIALVKTKESMEVPIMYRICLPLSYPLIGGRYLAIGMGTTSASKKYVTYPDELRSKYIYTEKCKYNCGQLCFCTKSPRAWTSDSGSPLIRFDYDSEKHHWERDYKQGQVTIIGMVHGFRDGQVVFLNVMEYDWWIRQVLSPYLNSTKLTVT